jgi:hypothetical protein
MRSAAAEIAVQRLMYLLVGWVRVAPEERGDRHYHAVAAVATLSGLLEEKGLLYRMKLTRRRVWSAQSFESGNLGAGDLRDRQHTGLHRLSASKHQAGAALLKPAAKARAIELKLITQHIQERRIRSRLNRMAPAVYMYDERLWCRHLLYLLFP